MMMMKVEMKFVATGGRGIFSGGVMFSENNAKFHVLPEKFTHFLHYFIHKWYKFRQNVKTRAFH